MLTIRKIVVAVGDAASVARAARYPLELADSPQAFARGDYYVRHGGSRNGSKAEAVWVGSDRALGALGLELGGDVTAEQLATVLQGRNVQTGAQIRTLGRVQRGHRRERVPGLASLDLTFSAPKSVSVLWSQAAIEQRAEIERAMLAGARAVVEHMTQTKDVVYGRGPNGTRLREPAAGAAAAAALHVTARRARGERIPSPQLHVHGLVVGVERSDGRLVAADSWEMFKHGAPLEGGAVGRAALADRLVELGYPVEAGTGRLRRFFEVKGVPTGLMERMSGRTRDVERAVRKLELARGEKLRGGALSVVASQTRQAKNPGVSGAQVARAWAAQGEEFGFGPRQAEGLRGRGGYRLALQRRRADARAEIARLVAQRGTLSLGAARAVVYEVAPGRLRLGEARALLEEMEQTGELLELQQRA